MASVVITYDKSTFSINYLSSERLGYNEKAQKIQKRYNRWVQLLDREIRTILY